MHSNPYTVCSVNPKVRLLAAHLHAPISELEIQKNEKLNPKLGREAAGFKRDLLSKSALYEHIEFPLIIRGINIEHSEV